MSRQTSRRRKARSNRQSDNNSKSIVRHWAGTQQSLIADLVPTIKRPSGYIQLPSDSALGQLQQAFPGSVVELPSIEELTKPRQKDLVGIDLKSTRSVSGCEHPIQLSGRTNHVSSDGEIVGTGDVSAYASCKTRRKTRCEPCSQLYQHDARHLIAAGLSGGKGVDEEEVSKATALFGTFTAPSFGPVHMTVFDKDGKPTKHCRPRRGGDQCPHGKELSCMALHVKDDQSIGQAICLDCYDYEGAVLWNNAASALWRVTRINISRITAKRLGMSQKAAKDFVRTEYFKVAEFQKRGLVHFHVVIRLDAKDIVAGQFDTETLKGIVYEAANRSEVDAVDGSRVTWGKQLDIKSITAEDEKIEKKILSRRRVTNYLAKYATKGSDVEGKLDRRFKNDEELKYLNVNDHLAKMVRTSWQLANKYIDAKLDYWSHQFGYRGHFLTKSRNWSTTFKALRQARKDHQEQLRKASWSALSDDSMIITKWTYGGSGYRSTIDAQLAEALRNKKQEQRRLNKAA